MISESILHQTNPHQKLDLWVYLDQPLPIESVAKKQKYSERARLDITIIYLAFSIENDLITINSFN